MLCMFYIFFLMIRRPPRSTRTDTLVPYTTLFRSVHLAFIGRVKRYKAPDLLASAVQDLPPSTARLLIAGYCTDADLTAELRQAAASAGNIHLQLEYLSDADRKSTRLNSSH